MRKGVLILIGAVVGLILLVVLCTYVKRPYEKVLLSRFGSLIEEKDQTRICYNWYFKWPTDSVERFDSRLHLYTSPLIQITTKGSETISLQTFVAWRIFDPVLFYKSTGGGSDVQAENQIGQIIQGRVPDLIGKHRLDELFNTDGTKVKTSEIEEEVARLATEDKKGADGSVQRPGLHSLGIQLVEVGFSRMAFAPENAVPVYTRMAAELQAKAQAFASDGAGQANVILGQGLKDAQIERDKASAEALRIRGEADAKANAILAAVQTTPEAREFYQYWKSIEFLRNSMSKNTVLVMPSDSKLLGPGFGAAAGLLEGAVKPAAGAVNTATTPGRP